MKDLKKYLDMITDHIDMTKARKFISEYYHIYYALLFPLTLFYFEVVFNLSTVKDFSLGSLFYTLLFSTSFGMLLYFIMTFFAFRARKLLSKILLFVLALPFIVEYFVYSMFKVFYDLNTVTGGAGGVVGDFLGQALEMVFSFSGLAHIFIFLLPFIVYCFVTYKLKRVKKLRIKRQLILSLSVLAFAFNTIFIRVNNEYRETYTTQYSFQDAVSKFGLFTGVRLDVWNNFYGGSTDYNSVAPQQKKKKNKTTIKYGKNELKIDFNALADKTSNSTWKSLDKYVASLTPASKNKYTGIFKGKNLIFLSCEAFSEEVIDKERTPTLYRLATKGINFTDYYVQASAGTTGGEYENVFGMLPTAGGQSFKKKATQYNYLTMGAQLNRFGYYGKTMHNNTYTFYDRHKTHNKLGYSDGYMGYGNGMEKYVKRSWPESDLEMIKNTIPTYIDKQPFNIYYMTVSGHSGYSKSGNAMTKKHWDRVSHLSQYNNDVKGYLAANMDLEDAMKALVDALEKAGIADDTVIVMSADHFPYGLDTKASLGNMRNLSNLKGYNVKTLMQRDHNRLIIWSGSLEKNDPIVVSEPASSIDILPTLSNLFGTQYDSRLFPGRDVFSDDEALIFNTNFDWKTNLGTYSRGSFTPKSSSTKIPENYVEDMKKIVQNKMNFCKNVLNSDYYRHVFSDYQIKEEKIVKKTKTNKNKVADQ